MRARICVCVCVSVCAGGMARIAPIVLVRKTLIFVGNYRISSINRNEMCTSNRQAKIISAMMHGAPTTDSTYTNKASDERKSVSARL